MDKLRSLKLKKQYWGPLTTAALAQNHIYKELISIDLIITITKIKSALIAVDPFLSKEIKAAVLSSAEEIIQERHNKQFPISIYSKDVEENINNNINEIIGYLVQRKIKKNIDLNILNLKDSYINITNNAICISLVQHVNKCLIPAINNLTSFFWGKKHNEKNSHQFSRRINLYNDRNEKVQKMTVQMSVYNKKINNQKKDIINTMSEFMILEFPSINIKEQIIGKLNEKYNLTFTSSDATDEFDNLKLWKLNCEIESLFFIIFQIIKKENGAIYQELSKLYLHSGIKQRSMLEFLNLTNKLIIHAEIINSINTLHKVIDYFIQV